MEKSGSFRFLVIIVVNVLLRVDPQCRFHYESSLNKLLVILCIQSFFVMYLPPASELWLSWRFIIAKKAVNSIQKFEFNAEILFRGLGSQLESSVPGKACKNSEKSHSEKISRKSMEMTGKRTNISTYIISLTKSFRTYFFWRSSWMFPNGLLSSTIHRFRLGIDWDEREAITRCNVSLAQFISFSAALATPSYTFAS